MSAASLPVVVTTRFEIGADASCKDGYCGSVTGIVVDSSSMSVTHIVVEPEHRSGLGKLVPIGLADVRDDSVRVNCNLTDFDRLDAAEETLFLPGNNGGYGGYSPGIQPVVSDLVPPGEITIKRDQPVHATDGAIGHIRGLVTETSAHKVTHVLLDEGHFWSRERVAIPIDAVIGVEGGLHVGITKANLADLSKSGHGASSVKPMIQYEIGAEASCRDGVCGEVSQLVMDPVVDKVTYLVIAPKYGGAPNRLVPIDLVDTTSATVRLTCDLAEFNQLGAAEETHFLPAPVGYGGFELGQLLSLPYYGLGSGGMAGRGLGGTGPLFQSVAYDRIPVGEVAIRRGEHVHAADGEIGRVEGLVVDSADHQVTHVLLKEGHLWGRKEIAIPIRDVIAPDKQARSDLTDGLGHVLSAGLLDLTDDAVRLRLTKQQVLDLPDVDIDHPWRHAEPGIRSDRST